jgi:hypothetical protein
MLLRRVIEHVREQNWLAVFIDFVIVVVGVFIGIQVANWNEERLNQREERILVERLRVDFERISEDAARSLNFHEQMTANLRTVVSSLRADALKDEDVAAFEQALVLGIAFQTSADHSGTFTELMSSGRANILRDRDLLDDLVDYEDFLTRFEFAQRYYIDLVMGAFREYTSAFGYTVDLQMSQELFDGTGEETSAPVIYDFDALSADPAFENAAEHLILVHSGFVLWRQRISTRVEAIQQRLAQTKTAN